MAEPQEATAALEEEIHPLIHQTNDDEDALQLSFGFFKHLF
jgi:hypothetical protein